MSAIRRGSTPYLLGLVVVVAVAIFACSKKSTERVPQVTTFPDFCSQTGRDTAPTVVVDFTQQPPKVVSPYIAVCGNDVITWKATTNVTFSVSAPVNSNDQPLNLTCVNSQNQSASATVQPQGDLPVGGAHYFAYSVAQSTCPGGGGGGQDPGIIIMR
jgi:hypothetical protein